MQLGSMQDVLLTEAKDAFLFNYRLAGSHAHTLSAYRDVLSSFVQITGDMFVRELTPNHVSAYIHALDDCPDKSKEHILRLEIDHYVVIHTWIRWMQIQRFVTEPYSSNVKPLDHRGACCITSVEGSTPSTFR